MSVATAPKENARLENAEVYLVFERDEAWEYTLKQIFRNRDDAIKMCEGRNDDWHYEPWIIK